MDLVKIWNSLSWLDGILFSIWVGAMYYGKCWIENHFREKNED